MKIFFLSFFTLILTFSFASAQASASKKAPDQSRIVTKNVGGMNIKLPIPKGFSDMTDQTSLSLEVAKRLAPTDDISVAYFLPTEVVVKSNSGDKIDRMFAVQVKIDKNLEKVESTAGTFAQASYELQTNLAYMDTAEGRDVVQKEEGKINSFLKDQASFSLGNPEVKGRFNVTPTSVSYLIESHPGFRILGKDYKVSTVMTTSLVLVRNRLLKINIYRNFKTQQDQDVLIALTSQWLQQIQEANR
jgi:hypothetical protein